MSTREYDQIAAAHKQLPQFNITQENSKKMQLVYQYRNFDSFWNILKSDSFWATNARFSNDEVEQQFGMEVISSICAGTIDLSDPGNMGLDENYIVCFCQEDDKLSQWRGYAPEGGVSLGFDFDMPRAFTVQQNKQDTVLDDILQYVGLDKVGYVSPKGSKDDQEYRQECQESLALVNSPTVEDEAEVFRQEIQKKAPYIKHSGFKEEDEYRLVFRNQNGQLDGCIYYRDTSNGMLRYPYIVVKCKLPKDPKSCAVRVCVSEKEIELTNKLEAALKATHPSLVHACHLSSGLSRDADEPFCTGCVLRRWQTLRSYEQCRSKAPPKDGEFEYHLHEDANCVIITQGENQKEIFEIVHKQVEEFCGTGPKISVWCEGHLPLRTITVGPCPNQSNMIEAIRHYCKHTYWLRDVEIIASTIPYRNSL